MSLSVMKAPTSGAVELTQLPLPVFWIKVEKESGNSVWITYATLAKSFPRLASEVVSMIGQGACDKD